MGTRSPAGLRLPCYSFFALTHFLVFPLAFVLVDLLLIPNYLREHEEVLSRWESAIGHSSPPAYSARWGVLMAAGEAYGTDVLGGQVMEGYGDLPQTWYLVENRGSGISHR